MAKIAVLYCGSHFIRGLLEKLLHLQQTPVVLPSATPLEDILSLHPAGVVISGSGDYVNDPMAAQVDQELYYCGVPVLGICYGLQRMVKDLDGAVHRMLNTERGCVAAAQTEHPSVLFRDFSPEGIPVWMAHTCKAQELPPGFFVTAATKATSAAAIEHQNRPLYAVQFHPEHQGNDPANQAGTAILWNFLEGVCGVHV